MWDDILAAARAVKDKAPGVVPVQLNAGTAMGEATSMQGLLPMLVGTGRPLQADGAWAGDTQGMRQVLNLYKTIYVDEGLGDPVLQQEASGRDTLLVGLWIGTTIVCGWNPIVAFPTMISKFFIPTTDRKSVV